MKDFFGRLFACSYLLMLAWALTLMCEHAGKGVAPVSLSSFGIGLLLLSVVLALWTRLTLSCVIIAFVGLVTDNVGLLRLMQQAPEFWGSLVVVQLIFVLLCVLLIIKNNERVRGIKAGTAIMP